MRLALTIAVTLAFAVPAAAQEDAPAHRITIVPPKPAPAPTVAAKKPLLILARPRQTSVPTDALAIRSASGVDRASQCRAQCGEARYVCSVDDGGGECDSRWTQCTVGCGGSRYTFPSSAYVPLAR